MYGMYSGRFQIYGICNFDLTFAWTLKAMTDSLGATVFVSEVMKHSATQFMNLIPALVFVVGCALAFATGTSWGNFPEF